MVDGRCFRAVPMELIDTIKQVLASAPHGAGLRFDQNCSLQQQLDMCPQVTVVEGEPPDDADAASED